MSKDSKTSGRGRKRGSYHDGARPEVADRKHTRTNKSALQDYDDYIVPSSPPDLSENEASQSGSLSDDYNEPQISAKKTQVAIEPRTPEKAILRSFSLPRGKATGSITVGKKLPKPSGFFGRTLPESQTSDMSCLFRSPGGTIFPASPIAGEPKSRPVAKLGEASGSGEFPEIVFTPGKTPHYCTSDVGPMAMYAKQGPRMPIPFPSLQGDKENLVTKTVIFELTQEKLDAVRKEIKDNGGRRSKTQNQVMGSSAKSHVEENTEDLDLEWLHLAGHQFQGKEAQVPGNLVVGTSHANTEMLVIAEQHVKGILDTGKSVRIEVTATMLEGSHVAKRIDYRIQRDGATDIKFSFDAQTKQRPSAIYGKYSAKYIERRLGQKLPEGR